MSSVLMDQQYILNKVSLNRNTHETSLRIGRFMRLMPTGSQAPNPVFPLGAMLPHWLSHCFHRPSKYSVHRM